MTCRGHPIMRVLGLLGAVLAFMAQLGLGPAAQADEARATEIAALLAVSVDCHGAPAGPRDRGTPRRHHRTEGALCPMRLALSLPDLVPGPAGVAMPRPLVAGPAAAGLAPPACGPPPLTARVGHPRAPPVPA